MKVINLSQWNSVSEMFILKAQKKPQKNRRQNYVSEISKIVSSNLYHTVDSRYVEMEGTL